MVLVVFFFIEFFAFVKTAGSSGTNEGTMTIDAGLTTVAGIRAVGTPTEYVLGITMAVYIQYLLDILVIYFSGMYLQQSLLEIFFL